METRIGHVFYKICKLTTINSNETFVISSMHLLSNGPPTVFTPSIPYEYEEGSIVEDDEKDAVSQIEKRGETATNISIPSNGLGFETNIKRVSSNRYRRVSPGFVATTPSSSTNMVGGDKSLFGQSATYGGSVSQRLVDSVESPFQSQNDDDVDNASNMMT